ncbi:hypothetical protein GF371_04825 [Candidatus Woesearchaeota archaeon]|nr:hypothetical protein [Candidatus Woesearchaeota archaeon]
MDNLTKIVLTTTMAGGILLGADKALAQEESPFVPPKKPGVEGEEQPGEQPGKQPGEQPAEQPEESVGQPGEQPAEKKTEWSTVQTQWGETFDNEDLKTEESKTAMAVLRQTFLANEEFKKKVGEDFSLTASLQKNKADQHSILFTFFDKEGKQIGIYRAANPVEVQQIRNVVFTPTALETKLDPALKPYLKAKGDETYVAFPVVGTEWNPRETKEFNFYRAAFLEMYEGKSAPEAVRLDRQLAAKDRDMQKKVVMYDAKEDQFYVVTHLDEGKTRRDKISERGVKNLLDAIARQKTLQTRYMSKEGILVNGERHNAAADKKALETELENLKKKNLDPKKDSGQAYSIDEFRALIGTIQDDKLKGYATNLMNIIYGAVQDPNLPQHQIAKKAGANLRMRIHAYDQKGKEANLFRVELYNGDDLAMTYFTTVNNSSALGGMNGYEVWQQIQKTREAKK